MPNSALKYLQKYCKVEHIPFAVITQPFLIAINMITIYKLEIYDDNRTL